MPGTGRLRWTAGLVSCLLLAGAMAACGGDDDERSVAEPSIGSWRTWVVSSSAIAVPPPPESGSDRAEADLAEVRRLVGRAHAGDRGGRPQVERSDADRAVDDDGLHLRLQPGQEPAPVDPQLRPRPRGDVRRHGLRLLLEAPVRRDASDRFRPGDPGRGRPVLPVGTRGHRRGRVKDPGPPLPERVGAAPRRDRGAGGPVPGAGRCQHAERRRRRPGARPGGGRPVDRPRPHRRRGHAMGRSASLRDRRRPGVLGAPARQRVPARRPRRRHLEGVGDDVQQHVPAAAPACLRVPRLRRRGPGS